MKQVRKQQKRWVSILVSLALFLTAVPLQGLLQGQAESGRLGNLDFEDGSNLVPDGWKSTLEAGQPQNVYRPNIQTPNAIPVHCGEQSLYVVKYGGTHVFAESERLSVTPGVEYALAGYAYIHGADIYNPGYAYVKVSELDANGVEITSHETRIAATDAANYEKWLATGTVWIASADTATVVVELGLLGGTSLGIYFDDFSLTKGRISLPETRVDSKRVSNLDFETGSDRVPENWTVKKDGQAQDAYRVYQADSAPVHHGSQSFYLVKFDGTRVSAAGSEMALIAGQTYEFTGYVNINSQAIYDPGTAYVTVTEWDGQGSKIATHDVQITAADATRYDKWQEVRLSFTANIAAVAATAEIGLAGGTSLGVYFDDFDLSAVRVGNLDFEAGTERVPEGWKARLEAGRAQDVYRPNRETAGAAPVYSGEQSLYIVKIGGGEQVSAVGPDSSVNPNQEYTLTGYVQVKPGDTYRPGAVYVRVTELDGKGQKLESHETRIEAADVSSYTQWKKVAVPFTTAAAAAGIVVEFGLQGGESLGMYFDNFDLSAAHVENAGFEAGTDRNAEGWTARLEAGTPQDVYRPNWGAAGSSPVHTGKYSMYIIKYGGNNVNAVSAPIAVQAGGAYTLTGYAYVDAQAVYNPGVAYIRVTQRDATGAELAVTTTFISAGKANCWLKAQASFTALLGTVSAVVEVGLLGGASLGVYFDDISLSKSIGGAPVFADKDFTGVPAPAIPNQLFNLDFEDGHERTPEGWTVSKDGEQQDVYRPNFPTDSAAPVHRGAQSVYVLKYDGSRVSTVGSPMVIKPGETYVLTGYARINSQAVFQPGAAYVKVTQRNVNEQMTATAITKIPVVEKDAWIKVQVPFVATADVATAVVELGVQGGTSLGVYFDDFSFTTGEATEPDSLVSVDREFSGTPGPADSGRLANLDFEAGSDRVPENWTVKKDGASQDAYRPNIPDVGSIPVHNGKQSFYIVKFDGSHVYSYSQEVQMTAGTDYELTGYAYVNPDALFNPGTAYVKVLELDADGNALETYVTEFDAKRIGRWLKVKVPFTASPKAASAVVELGLQGGTSMGVYFDDFSFTKGETQDVVYADGNYDFESVRFGTPTSWDYVVDYGTGKLEMDTAYFHSGKKSVHITRSEAMGYSMLKMKNPVAVTAGDVLQFTCYVKSAQCRQSNLALVVQGFQEDGTLAGNAYGANKTLSEADTPSEWKPVVLSYKVPGNVTHVKLMIRFGTGVSNVWVDDVQVSKQKELIYQEDFNSLQENGKPGDWVTTVTGGSPAFDAQTQSAVITKKKAEDAGCWSTQLKTLHTGYTYRLSGRYTTTGAAEGQLRMTPYDYRNAALNAAIDKKLPVVADWTSFSFEFTAVSATLFRLDLGTAAGAGSVSFDDVELVEVAKPASGNLWEGQWISYMENIYYDAVYQNRYFRHHLSLGAKPREAYIQLTADDKWTLYVNGHQVERTVGSGDTWDMPQTVDISEYLNKGDNVIAFDVRNNVYAYGLLYDGIVKMADGSSQRFCSSAQTKASKTAPEAWTTVAFDDTGWMNSSVFGSVPISPWGNIEFDPSIYSTYSMTLTDIVLPKQIQAGETLEISAVVNSTQPLTGAAFPINLWKKNSTEVICTMKMTPVGTMPDTWPTGQDVPVTFSMTIPRYLTAGAYTLQLSPLLYTVESDAFINNKFANIEVTQIETKLTTKAEVKEYNGKTTLFINGIPQSMMQFLRADRAVNYDVSYVENMAKSGVNKVGVFGYLDGRLGEVWKADGTCNFKAYDTMMNETLAGNPDAEIMMHIDLTPPDWWLKAHPQECSITNNGVVSKNSFASLLWRQEAGEVVKQLLQYVMKQPYANSIYAVRLTAGTTLEWQTWGVDEEETVDFSTAADTAFRQWLRNTYEGDVAKLQKAWNNPTITFEKARVPSREERLTSEYINYLDPEAQRNVIDFHLYMSDVTADSLLYFADLVKAETDNRLLVGAYYGYIWNLESYNLACGTAHLALDRVLESKSIDFIAAPAAYNQRDLGLSSSFMTMVESVKLHGKLFLSEQDNRTVRVESSGAQDVDASLGQTYTNKDTMEQLRRDFANNLVKGTGLWWYDMYGGWFDEDQMYGSIRVMKQEMDLSVYLERKSTSDVAVFVDSQQLAYTTYDKGTEALYSALFRHQIQNLYKMGAPYDMYLLSDLVKGLVPDYKINIMLSPVQLTGEERQAIDTYLKKDNKVLVWIYLPGLSDGSTMDIDRVSKLVGMDLALDKERANLSVKTVTGDHPLVQGTENVSYGVPVYQAVGPCPYVTDTQATALGYLTETERIGLAVKEMPGWMSVYSAVPNLPAGLLHNLLAYTDSHVYSENPDDVIYADNHYVAIHSAFAGEKTLSLPGEYAVYDVFEQKVVQPRTSTIQVTMGADETKLFRLLTPNKIAISAAATTGGTISPNGLIEVDSGKDCTFSMTAAEGYVLQYLLVDGERVPIQEGTFTLQNIQQSHVLQAVFKEPAEQTNPDTDTDPGPDSEPEPSLPNTGNALPWFVWVLSGTAIVGLTAARRRKRKLTKQ